jgi:uncharacterized protein (DUF983 family)
MIKKGQKLYSIIFQKCPRCHEGALWKYSFWRAVPELLKGKYHMYDRCNICQLKYEQEPGFWWGAMYISYALSSIALLGTAFVCKFLLHLSLAKTMLMVLLIALLGFLYNARIARVIYINLFVHYNNQSNKES